jgi:hypothetical protein
LILARLPVETRTRRLLSIYARYILPGALATSVGLDALAYRLYVRMMNELVRDVPAHRAVGFVS